MNNGRRTAPARPEWEFYTKGAKGTKEEYP
jgi:hypothetical protein